MQESGTGTDGPSNPADRLTTDESQLAIDNSSADYAGKDDKKSVLRKVKDKMKKLGNKLKPKSHGHGVDDKQEIIDQSAGDEEEEEEEEVEEVPTPDKTLQTNPKDLDVPLDEYALLKQKEAENKGGEGSVQGRGLEDSLTDGLSSQSIAEQEPTTFRDPGPSGVLQAVPTNYHYKEGEVDKADEDNKDQVGASEETKPSLSQAVPTEDDNEKLDLPKEEQKPETSELNFNENAREEPLERSAGNNEVTQQDQGPGIFASKDGVTPTFTSGDIQALSKSNLYTGEPDVKSAEDMKAQNPEKVERDIEVPKTADKASEAEAAPQKVGFGDNESASKQEKSELEKANDTGDLKAEKPDIQDEKSAESKLQDESFANEGSYKPSAASSTVTDRDINTSESGIPNEGGDSEGKFVDAKPEMEPASRALDTESSTNENAGAKFEVPPETLSNDNEQSAERGDEKKDDEGKFVDAKPEMEPASRALDSESSSNENAGAKFEEPSETLSNDNEQSAERGDEKKDDEVSEYLKEQKEPANDSGTQQMETSGAAESVASPDESRESKESEEVKIGDTEGEPVEENPSKETGTQMRKSGAAEAVASPDESKESKELDDVKDMNIDTGPVDVKERNPEVDEPIEENPSKENKVSPTDEEAEPVEENPSKENEAPPTNDSQSPSMAQRFMDSISTTFGYSAPAAPQETEDAKAQQQKFIDDKTTDLLHAQAQ